MTDPHRRPKSAVAALNLLVVALFAAGCTTLTEPVTAPTTEPAAVEVPAPAAETAAPAPVAISAESTTPNPLPEALSAPVVTPLGPLAPRGRLDPAQDADRGDLWQRVRDGFAMPDVDNELVRKWEQWYARDPAYVQRMTERGGRYLFHIIEEVQRRGMPAELALLPFIESAFNPQAMSRAAASGMWQFMPATGKDFELRQNFFRDDRRDVLASTRAALDYLDRLHGMFGDWHLALAAYNWGQGNVMRAQDRNRRAGLPTDYLSLQRVPLETREYVPKLQAVKNIVLRPEGFGLNLVPLENHPFFLSVPIERDIDVALAARLAGLSLDEFQQLNPQLNKPVILAAGTPQVLLPYDNANNFVAALSAHGGPMASWTAWVAPRTLKTGDAAKLVGMDEDDLRDLNRIPPRMLVKAGSTLLVPRAPHTTVDVAEHVADHGLLTLAPDAPPLRRVSFKAGRQGDSVAAVAKRYRVSVAQVAQWNKVGAGTRFKAGQAIVVMLPGQAGGTRAAAKPTPTRNTAKAASSTRNAKAKAPAGATKAAAARSTKKTTTARSPAPKAAPRVRMAQGGEAQNPPR